jgi:hypothetical protein
MVFGARLRTHCQREQPGEGSNESARVLEKGFASFHNPMLAGSAAGGLFWRVLNAIVRFPICIVRQRLT